MVTPLNTNLPLDDIKNTTSLTHPARVQLRNKLVQTLAVKAQEDFLVFCQMVYPNFQIGPHHRLLAKKLMQLEKGTIKRLMFFLPPRSSKSLMSTILYPAWVMGRHASWFTIALSYGSKLSTGFGREVRDLIESPAYKLIFPNTKLRPDVKAAGMWKTGGGGEFFAGSMTGGIAGHGAHLTVIDDPLSEQDAYSASAREHVNNIYTGGVRSRLQPAGRIALVMTRWNEDDLAGHLLKLAKEDPTADQWEVVSVPAIINEYTDNECSYWPVDEEGRRLANDEGIHTGWPLEELQATRANTPPYQWNAIYMQNPSTEEGAIIKRDYWQAWEEDKPPECEYTLMSCDTAYSAKTSADFSAFTVWGVFRDRNNVACLILLAGERHRIEYPELRRRAQELYEKYKPDGVLIEKKASGQSLIPDLRAAGVPVIEYNPDKDKVARAHACTPLFHAKRIYYPKNKRWVESIIDECASFPYAANDDYVDTVTQAVIWMRDGTWVIHPQDAINDDSNKPTNKRRLY